MKNKYIYPIIFLAVFLLIGIMPAMAQEPEPPSMPGTVEGTGTLFEVTDSDYLNVTLQSTESITVMLESAASMVLMDIDAIEGGGTSQLTLTGLAPSTTYYMYDNSYANGGAITTDAGGNYFWTQNLSGPHHVWLQPGPSTKFIRNDATGGDCTSIGTWDSGTKTCTLTTTVYETVVIMHNNVTLDGAGYTVQGPGYGYGIYLELNTTGLTVKNVRVQNFSRGITFRRNNSGNTLTNNTASNNYHGILIYSSSYNTLTGNTVSSNSRYGIFIGDSSNNNTVTGNTATNNSFGIYLHSSNNNTLMGNSVSANNGNGIRLSSSSYNTVTGNTLSNNKYGMPIVSNSNNNHIYNNNFISNTSQAIVSSSSGNIFNLPAPTGGNYWNDWTSPDTNGDGFVDNPYVFLGGVDNLPLTTQYSLNEPPVANAGDNIQITSDSQTFTVIEGTATDTDEDALQFRWLKGTEVVLDWTSVGTNGEAHLDLATLPYLEIGNHTLTLEVTDGTETVTDDMLLTIDNSPPEVQPAPSSQVVEIGIDPITIIADVADFDGDTVTYECIMNSEVLDFGSVDTLQGGDTVQIPDVVVDAGDPRFPLGTNELEMKVSDSVNTPVSAFVSVTVIDTTAPSLSPLPSITMLWPPNHSLQPVTVQANAFDNGGGTIHLDVIVASSELPDMDGSGNTIPDYYIDSVNDQTGMIELRLRSERSGKGEGRTYTINITATDESGNQSQAHVEVRAPHDRRKK